MKDFELLKIQLDLFNTYTNKTTDTTASTGNDLSGEMKTFYSDYLIDLAEPELVHDQFGQKHPIPKNGGKTIEFRKYDPLPKMLTPLAEGETPQGQKMNMGVITATVNQYGGFIELSDILLLTAIDNNLMEATKLLAGQAGRTLDTITREVLNGGTNVLYCGGKSDRSQLVGGDSTPANNDYLNVQDVKKAVRALKVQNAPKINGYYVGIIHPDASFDLTNDPEWKYPHQYVDTEELYNGEIGRVAGVRFVEATEAKVFHGEDLSSTSRTLTVYSNSSGTTVTIKGTISEDDINALKARAPFDIIINTTPARVVDATYNSSANSSTLTLESAVTATANQVIYPGAGAGGRDVYSTLILGADAYGVTEVSGGGLQHIVKQLGSAGSADPLDQRATAGWKAIKTAERLVEQYMIRVESASTFEVGAN